jgi:peptidoglycan/LPS O-acetylase OafA/YrhL
MRAVAIVYVMLSHGYTYSAQVVDATYYRWLILDGVGLFFVLSGFLIGGILIRQIEAGPFGLKELRDFWVRRWMRTLPAYFLVLTFLLGCYYYSHGELPPVWPRYYIFSQNLLSPHPLFFGEAWSLSVEEWFYLLVPLGLFFLLRSRIRKRWVILTCIVTVLLLVTGLRLYKVSQHDYFAAGNLGSEVLKVVVTRLDAIMYGVLGAWLGFYFKSAFYRHRILLFVLGLLTLFSSNALMTDFFLTRLHHSLAPIAALCLLPALSSLKNGEGRVYRVVTFISLISYSMYLTNHMIVQRGVMPVISRWLELSPQAAQSHALLAYLLFWTFTILAAYSLYRLVEKPFMELRRALPRKESVVTG